MFVIFLCQFCLISSHNSVWLWYVATKPNYRHFGHRNIGTSTFGTTIKELTHAYWITSSYLVEVEIVWKLLSFMEKFLWCVMAKLTVIWYWKSHKSQSVLVTSLYTCSTSLGHCESIFSAKTTHRHVTILSQLR